MATPTGNFAGVAMGDIDKDGYLEVLSGCREKKKGLFLFSYKNSQWTKAQISSKGRYGGVELADVAGEGVKILLNNGNASPFTTLSLVTDTYEDTAIALGDLNADKRLDVVVTNHPGKNPRVFLCSASGTVSYSTAYVDGLNIPPTIGYKRGMADFDADGHADLAIGTRTELKLFLGNGCVGAESTW